MNDLVWWKNECFKYLYIETIVIFWISYYDLVSVIRKCKFTGKVYDQFNVWNFEFSVYNLKVKVWI